MSKAFYSFYVVLLVSVFINNVYVNAKIVEISFMS